jgi:hypothetical protein
VRTIKLFAVIGLAVALVAVPALVQGQQPTTINVRCSAATPSKPEIPKDSQSVKLSRGQQVQWVFADNLASCAQGLQSVKITFNNNNHPFQGQPQFTLNLTQQARTLGPYTVKPDASLAQYPYQIEFFSQQNAGGNPIPNTTINGQATVIEVTPTLTEWGLIALAVLLAGGMGYMIYRRRPALRPAAP